MFFQEDIDEDDSDVDSTESDGTDQEDIGALLQAMESEDEDSFNPSTSSLNFAARSRKKNTKVYEASQKRAAKDQHNYIIEKHPRTYFFTIKKKLVQDNTYNVEFMEDHVTCTCPDFRKYEGFNIRNEGCKHISLIIGKCQGDKTCYTGQRRFGKNEFDKIAKLLDTFDEDHVMTLNKGQENVNNNEINHIPTKIIPVTQTFSKQEGAKNAAPSDCEWMAEFYVTESGTNKGRKSTCRQCKSVLQRQKLCIRADV